MGSSLSGVQEHSSMKTILAVVFILGIHLSVAVNEKFTETIKIGKAKVKCQFTLSYTTTSVALSKSKASCSPKSQKAKSISQTLTAPSGFVFQVKLRIDKPDTKLLSAEISQVPEAETTEAPATTTTTKAETPVKTTTEAAEETTAPSREGKEATTAEESLPGDWVVIQRRGQMGNPADYFEKTMDEYAGFEANGESWLGLERMAEMTGSGIWELQVDLIDWSGRVKRVSYADFRVGAAPRYELTAASYDFSSPLRDALKYHNGAPFSTVDQDQDDHSGSCSQKYGGGGWWYRKCYHANLNGQNEEGGRGGSKAARWFNLKIKEATLKIRKIAN